MRELRDVFAATGRLIRHDPLVALAALPPWGFLPETRRWIAERAALEDAHLRLRALTGDDYDRYVIVAETLREWARQRGVFTGYAALSESESLEAVTDLIARGETPTNVDVAEKYQLLCWGML